MALAFLLPLNRCSDFTFLQQSQLHIPSLLYCEVQLGRRICGTFHLSVFLLSTCPFMNTLARRLLLPPRNYEFLSNRFTLPPYCILSPSLSPSLSGRITHRFQFGFWNQNERTTKTSEIASVDVFKKINNFSTIVRVS